MPELLIELLSEEIPARMQAQAARDFERMARERLIEAGLEPGGLRTFAGPRRLSLVAELPAAQGDRTEELKGPKTSAPEQALEGFLRKTGLTRDRLTERDGVWFAVIERKGRRTTEVVAEMVEDIVRNFPWPKSMTWGAGKLRWVRPLRRILCVFDRQIVPFSIDGIESGDLSEGHRFMGTGKPFRARDFDEYREALAGHFVVLDPADRKARILAGARKLCAARKLELVEDEGLLEEVAGLAEWPVPVLGDMDAGFLDLPPEVIRTSMRTHQKYFAVRTLGTDKGETSGPLAPHFITVANIDAEDGGKAIAAGNAKVLSARLSDARFFWDEDRKVKLEDRLEALKGVTFHAKLGTMYERVERIEALARDIAPLVGADPDVAAKAARLAKADLATGMVGEFPELQGVMGGYYARKEKLREEIADAIRDHYKPQGPNDELPSGSASLAVALADKLDTLVSFFAIDEKPTGSRDPYALRRAALGVIRGILENKVRLPLRSVLMRKLRTDLTFLEPGDISRIQGNYQSQEANADLIALLEAVQRLPIASTFLLPEASRIAEINRLDPAGYDRDPVDDSWLDRIDRFTLWHNKVEEFRGGGSDLLPEIDELGDEAARWAAETVTEVLSFLADRLKVILRDQGKRHDLVDAVFALGDDDLVRIVRRVEALDNFLSTDDGTNLLAGYRRAVNILKAEEKKGVLPSGPPVRRPAPAAELALMDTVEFVAADLEEELAAEDFTAAMTALAALRGPVDAFFNKVLVNSPDAKERDNRLKLLGNVRDAMGRVADFSLISG